MENIVERKITKGMKDVKNILLMRMRKIKKYFMKMSKYVIRINTSRK